MIWGGILTPPAGTNQGLKTGAGVIFAPIQMDLGPDGDNPICIKENSTQRPTDTELVGQQATPGVRGRPGTTCWRRCSYYSRNATISSRDVSA